MVMDRRRFLRTGVVHAAGVGVGLSACAKHPGAAGVSAGENPFQHGVASGDPLSDRIILWTRVSPLSTPFAPPLLNRAFESIRVDWWIARDRLGQEVVGRGRTEANSARDYTIKVDAEGLEPGSEYYFGFSTRDGESPVGRTRTLPVATTPHLRMAVTSCANFPMGFFNVYRAIAARDDLEVVLHLGDYLYEYGDGQYGDGATLGRMLDPIHEIITLEDYRRRHANYKSDLDLQAAHARHPWITVWDDHEIANNASRDGAENHDESEGEWQNRKLSAIRAYYEWMPIRELPTQLFRRFRFGTLADLIMLDTRLHGRDEAAGYDDHEAASVPSRSLLGEDQTRWLLDSLSESKSSGTAWRIIGQQVVFAPFTDGVSFFNPDSWDGYRENRRLLLDHLAQEEIDNVVFLTGDLHSAWAMEVPPPMTSDRVYDPVSGAGSQAVEFVTPAVSSPPLGHSPRARKIFEEIGDRIPHGKYMNLDENGFVILDLTHERARAEFVYVDTTLEPSSATHPGPTLQTLSGTNQLLSTKDFSSRTRSSSSMTSLAGMAGRQRDTTDS
ncbi:MAG: alkaline phosphatase D family protein [Myxococcota bacterium]